LRAVKSETAPTDPFILTAYNAYTRIDVNEPYEYACDLIRKQDDKDVVVAFFLSGAGAKETAKSLGIPEDVLEIFRKLVIDLSVFRNKLELLRYAQTYRTTATAKGSELVELGVVQGPFALMHHFLHGHEELDVDSKMYARSMMQQAFYFGMMSRGNTIKSSVTQQSLKWLSATASLLKDYDRILGDSHDSDEALLEIEKKQMTKTPEELGVNVSDILHTAPN
jgi:hypothetical protein